MPEPGPKSEAMPIAAGEEQTVPPASPAVDEGLAGSDAALSAARLGEIVRAVEGPAEAVVRLLREAGLNASISEDGAVEVASSDRAAVERAVALLADGDIVVVLVNP